MRSKIYTKLAIRHCKAGDLAPIDEWNELNNIVIYAHSLQYKAKTQKAIITEKDYAILYYNSYQLIKTNNQLLFENMNNNNQVSILYNLIKCKKCNLFLYQYRYHISQQAKGYDLIVFQFIDLYK